MTVDEFWRKMTGRSVAEYVVDLKRWEELQKPAHERAIRRAMTGKEEW